MCRYAVYSSGFVVYQGCPIKSDKSEVQCQAYLSSSLNRNHWSLNQWCIKIILSGVYATLLLITLDVTVSLLLITDQDVGFFVRCNTDNSVELPNSQYSHNFYRQKSPCPTGKFWIVLGQHRASDACMAAVSWAIGRRRPCHSASTMLSWFHTMPSDLRREINCGEVRGRWKIFALFVDGRLPRDFHWRASFVQELTDWVRSWLSYRTAVRKWYSSGRLLAANWSVSLRRPLVRGQRMVLVRRWR